MLLDTWTQKVRGRQYWVQVEDDPDTAPSDFECYTKEQAQAWVKGEWGFCGVIVTPDLPGLDPKQFPASLWGVEYGNIPGAENADAFCNASYIRKEIVPELAGKVWARYRETLTELRAVLTQALYETR